MIVMALVVPMKGYNCWDADYWVAEVTMVVVVATMAGDVDCCGYGGGGGIEFMVVVVAVTAMMVLIYADRQCPIGNHMIMNI
ncbi:hypothetical protein ACFX2H_022613 [Malus domestica]